MITTIEITAGAIRLCACADQRITALEAWPVPPGADPVAALASAPLPDGLGRVRVLLHHDDLLTRTLVQPSCPPERLDKLVRFELGDLTGPGSEDAPPSAVSWHLVPVGGDDGDMRVLAQVTRLRLVDRVRQALAARGAKLAALGHPALGVFHAFTAQVPAHQGIAVLVDVGGTHVHLVLVKDGSLVFLRSHTPGMDDLVRQIAAKRGLAEADAAALVRKIGTGSPEDLKDLITAHAGQISAAISSNLRFARTQLKLTEFEPTHIYLAGAGALAFGFTAALAERSRLPVRLLNPFAGQRTRLPTELSDRLAGLPSPWCAVVGGAGAATWELDALADERRSRNVFWRTEGALKIAAIIAVLCSGLGVVRLEVGKAGVDARLAELEQVVPRLQQQSRQATTAREAQQADAARLMWLDGERRSGRVAVELLAAIGRLQDPRTCPVVLTGMSVSRQAGAVQVDLQGAATNGTKVRADAALRTFKESLPQSYPFIATPIGELPAPLEKDRLAFRFKLLIPDA